MALSKSIKVPLPKKGIAYKKNKINNTKYVYYTTHTYRDKNGKPTNRRTAIGKLDENTGMLIPNNNYYLFFEDTNINFSPKSILDFGPTFLTEHILKSLNISNYLCDSFGNKMAKNIETIAFYMSIDSSVMFYLEDFCNSNYIKGDNIITSSNSSSIFDKINHDDRMEFHKKWANCIGEKEYIAYDVTSISSYAGNQEDVEYGYNRDKEMLPQINLGMYFGQDSGLPIFYTKYGGSILDKSYLKYMMRYNKELNIENVNFVMDKGFYTKENIIYMKNEGYPFIMCVSNKLITSKNLLEKHGSSIISYSNYLKDMDIYGVNDIANTYGVKTNVHIYYDEVKARIQKKDLYKKVERYEFELEQLKNLSKKQYKHYNKYFDLNINEDETFEYKKSSEKIDDFNKKLGYFILISTVENKNPNEILEIYRKKDKVEKCFDNLKNYVDLKRLRTHKDSTSEGKIFVSFISLIIKSYIEYKLKDYFLKNNTSTKKIFSELKKIKIIKMSNGKSLMSPLNSKQKQILNEFNISENDIQSYVNSI